MYDNNVIDKNNKDIIELIELENKLRSIKFSGKLERYYNSGGFVGNSLFKKEKIK